MGKKLDAFLGRGFKTSKFKTLVNLALSRLAVLKNHRQVRCSQARSDVSQLLNQSHQDRALLRVEQVMKEQNMLDVFIMIEGYCHTLLERLVLIENNKVCPDELQEAIASLIFAASRCGEFPELQEIRAVFIARYGKDFAARAIELRNNCGVNRKMIQKLSTRQPSLESRQKLLKEIATEIGITLHFEEETPVNNNEDNLDLNQNHKQHENDPPPNLEKKESAEIDRDEQFSGSMNARKYRDVASAAQAAFESAAYAAAAARAAVELSRYEAHDKGFDDDDDYNDDNQSRPTTHRRNRYDDSPKFRFGTTQSGNTGSGEAGLDNEKIQPIYHSSSESEVEVEMLQNLRKFHPEESKERRNNKEELKRSFSYSSSDSDGDTMKETKMYSNNVLNKGGPSEEMVFDESDDETGNHKGRFPQMKHNNLAAEGKTSLSTDEYPNTRQTNTYMQSGENVRELRLNIERKPISMRTPRK